MTVTKKVSTMKTSREIKNDLLCLGVAAKVFKVNEEGEDWTKITPRSESPDFSKEQCNVIQLYLRSIGAVSIAAFYGQDNPEDFGVMPHMAEFHSMTTTEIIANNEEDYGLSESIKSL